MIEPPASEPPLPDLDDDYLYLLGLGPPPNRAARAAGLAQAPPATPSPGSEQAVCLRQTPRQATSAVAHVADEPEDDDPLLAFVPYRHLAPRGNSITPERQRRFIATLAATGIVSQAARSIGKSMEALYKLRHKPGAEGFAAAWDTALERGMQRLEDCALQRAIQGTPTPIVSGGQILGTWHKPDNNLLRFMLQHRQSGRYGVQRIQPGHPVYESIKAEVLAEANKDRLGQEVATIESINAKIDKVRITSDIKALHQERGEVEDALRDLGLEATEVLAIPLTTVESDSDVYRLWLKWQHPGMRRIALAG